MNIRAVDPGSPASPSLVRNLAIAVGLGLVLGVAVAFLRDSLDNTVNDIGIAQRRLGIHFLGALPVLETTGDGKARSVSIRRRDAEAFRSIRTSLRFAGDEGRPLNVMGVSSPAPGEGKTLCYPGDIMPTAAHLRTGYLTSYDLYPVESHPVKEQLVERACREDWLLAPGHDDDHPLIRLVRRDKGYGFEDVTAT